jgi:hypothetical protein
MTDEAYCNAIQDWLKVKSLWRRASEEAASKAAHASLDEFIKPAQKPEPPPERGKV